MADKDMTPTNGFDPVASYARLSERVEGQGKDLVDIRSNMNTGFHQVNANISALGNETRSSINAITNELRGSSRTQWPVIWAAIGVSFTVLAGVGVLAYRPVLAAQDRMEQAQIRQADAVAAVANNMSNALTELAKNTVTRQELDWRAARGAEDRVRTDEAIKTIRAELLPRAEWAERNLNRDHEIANLQRQLDLQRSDFQTFSSSLGNGRDVIQDLKSELDRLRDQLAEIRARQYQRLGAPPT